MNANIRDLTSTELRLFGNIVSRLSNLESELEPRQEIFADVVQLMRGDYGASCIWNPQLKRFEKSIHHNMDPANLRNYDRYYQFHDPMSLKLRDKRGATFVEEVCPRRDLMRTEFYNHFLKKDGLHHGISIFLFDGARDLGDLRIWRAEGRLDFGHREKIILDTLAPFLQRAILSSVDRFEGLTVREREIAFLVARGYRDREICEMLDIGFSTVRTHLNKAMEKKGCANRAELAALVTHKNNC
jgi:DNA-binding CsgD family transcriptional regulator